MHPTYSGGAEPYVLRLHVLDLLVKPLLLLIRHLAPGRHAGRARSAELLVEPCLLLVRRQHSESPLAQDEQIDRSRASRSNKNYRRRTRSHHRGFVSQRHAQSDRDEGSVVMAEFVNSNRTLLVKSHACSPILWGPVVNDDGTSFCPTASLLIFAVPFRRRPRKSRRYISIIVPISYARRLSYVVRRYRM
jgi:hypothetical protein